MSILFHLKKIFDPARHREQKDDQEHNRLDIPLGLAEGDGLSLELPEPDGTPTYVCAHCGFISEKTNTCRTCLTFMEERRS